MSNRSTPSPIFRKWWKPAFFTGAGSTAVAVWLDEILMFGEDILSIIFLPIMAGVIYLLDIIIFKSRIPRRADLGNVNTPGAKTPPKL